MTILDHCVKSVQIRSSLWSTFFRIRAECREIQSTRDTRRYKVLECKRYTFFRIRAECMEIQRDTKYLSVFSPNTRKYGPEKTPYLDTFHTVDVAEVPDTDLPLCTLFITVLLTMDFTKGKIMKKGEKMFEEGNKLVYPRIANTQFFN